MSIDFQCPHCHKSYRTGDDKAGKKFQCQGCQAPVTVPGSAGDKLVDDFGTLGESDPGVFEYAGAAAPPPRLPRKRSNKAPGRSTKSAKNRKKKESAVNNTTMLIAGIAAGVLLIGGLAFGGWMLFKNDDFREMLADAATSAGGSGDRNNSEMTELYQQFREIGVAMHNYHDTYQAFPVSGHGRMPPSDWFDENGRPHLSWRVFLLPFLDQAALFDQFHLNEPWDSPHNRALLSQMPDMYRSPDSSRDDTNTRFIVLMGPSAPFSLDGPDTRIRDFKDGVSNTILVVEVGSDRAVPWTKPDDGPFDASNPLSVLGQIEPYGIPVLLGDGSPFLMRPDVAPGDFLAWVTHDGQEAANPSRVVHPDAN